MAQRAKPAFITGNPDHPRSHERLVNLVAQGVSDAQLAVIFDVTTRTITKYKSLPLVQNRPVGLDGVAEIAQEVAS